MTNNSGLINNQRLKQFLYLLLEVVIAMVIFAVMLLLTGGKPSGLAVGIAFCLAMIAIMIFEIRQTQIDDKSRLVWQIFVQGKDNRNLMRADLSGTNLSGANLIKANLSRANLFKANLSGADLSGANLIEANLRGANLNRANLNRANLIEANLSGANLIEVYLIEAKLRGADLSGAKLMGADLSGANLEGATVEKAIFIMTQGIDKEAQTDLEKRGAIFDDNETSNKELFT